MSFSELYDYVILKSSKVRHYVMRNVKMLTILSGRDARRGKGFLENAENAQGNKGGHRNGEKEIFN